MTHRRALFLHLWLLWITAAILRLGYFILALQHLGMEKLWQTCPDTHTYTAIAQHLLSENARGVGALFKYGPGYGLILAGLQKMFGPAPLYAYLFNIFIGSLAPVSVYLIAYHLTRSRAVALISGLISAVSTTSIALSCNVLSDQPFFTIHAVSLLCFILGFSSRKKRWFILAGLLAGFAAYIRGIGQFWPIIFILVPIVLPLRYEPKRGGPLPSKFSSRLSMIKRSSLTAGVMLVLILAWSARNYFVHDVFVFGSNGVNTARAYLLAKAVANHTDDADVLEIRRRWSEEDAEYFGVRTPTFAESYRRNRDQCLQICSTHPGWVFGAFWETVWGNMRGGNYIAKHQVPVFQHLWWRLIFLNRSWLAPLIVLVALLGLVFLYVDRRHLAWVLLGATYVYFTFITGFSFWQGSRLHYTAEMAWAILVAYAVFRVGLLLIKLARRLDLQLAISNRIAAIAHRTTGLLRPKGSPVDQAYLGLDTTISRRKSA